MVAVTWETWLFIGLAVVGAVIVTAILYLFYNINQTLQEISEETDDMAESLETVSDGVENIRRVNDAAEDLEYTLDEIEQEGVK